MDEGGRPSKDEKFLESVSEKKRIFLKKYKLQYEGTANVKGLYHNILNSVHISLSKGDIEKFKKYLNFMLYLEETEDKDKFNQYFDDIKNPLRNNNLIILICKHNRENILNYLFDIEFNILKKLPFFSIDRLILLADDKDEYGHNAFYYAISSGNVNLIDTLINKWPNDYFVFNSEELAKFLSEAYSELKIKNVLLSEEMEYFVAHKLISINFFSKELGQSKTAESDTISIKERIDLVLKNINKLKNEYQVLDVDEKFLYIITFIAKNIYVLKAQLKSTYSKIPWEEMEFFLVAFISSYKKEQELNLFYRSTLDKIKLLHYLDIFAQIVNEANEHLTYVNMNKPPPRLPREKVINELTKQYPQLEVFYTDYQHIRDITTLDKMNTYLKLVASAEPDMKLGKLVITRALQVIGEHLKNTLESPKLSAFTSEHLLLQLPKNTRRLLTGLRDSLSHAQSLFKRTEIEDNTDSTFFKEIQVDAKKLGDLIEDIFYKFKMNTINVLLKNVVDCENEGELKKIFKILNSIDLTGAIIENISSKYQGEVEKYISELNAIIPYKTDLEKALINKMNEVNNSIKSNKEQITARYMMGLSVLKSLSVLMNDEMIKVNEIRGIKFSAGEALKNLESPIDSSSLKELATFIKDILNSILSRNLDINTNTELYKLILKIFLFVQFEINDVRYIGKLMEKLSAKSSQRGTKYTCKQTTKSDDNHLTLKLSQLNDLLSNNLLLTKKRRTKFNLFETNDKLLAAIEMLVLDSMSILDTSKKCLTNNLLNIDDPSPFLSGRSLRNHLAHGNILLDLVSNTTLALAINAQKLISENIVESDKNIGKQIYVSLSSMQSNFEKGLVVLETQENMFEALKEGNMEKLESCLKNGADLNARSLNARTTLHFAAMGPNLEIMKFLLENNLDPKALDVNGQNPLHIAAANGRSMLVEFLLEKGLDVKCVENFFKTPAHLASMNGHLDTIKILYKYGAKTSQKDARGHTISSYAISHGHVNIAKFILKQEPHVDYIESMGGFNSLHIAAEKGFLEMVNFLIQNKANVNVKNDKSWTPLHAASFNGHLEVVETLISNGADVNAKIYWGGTPLHFATETDRLEIVHILLKNDAEANVADKIYGNTPLHYAAKDGLENIARALLNYNACPDVLTLGGLAPLHLASDYRQLGVIHILLKHGANINIKTKDNLTALHIAASKGWKDVVICLIKNGATIEAKSNKGDTPLYAAVSSGKRNVVQILIENKANVNVKIGDGSSLLHAAALSGKKDVIAILLKNNLDINAITSLGETPLHLAAIVGNKEVVEHLIKNNAKLNEKDSVNMTPLQAAIAGNHNAVFDILFKKLVEMGNLSEDNFLLHLAVISENKEAIKALLANGTDVNAKFEDITPLISAIEKNNKDIVQILIAHGADVNAEDGFPLLKAIYECKIEIVIILLRNNASVNLCPKYFKNSPKKDVFKRLGLQGVVKPSQLAIHLNPNWPNDEKRGKSPFENLDICKKDIFGGGLKYITPLHLASSRGYESIACALISHGAKINALIYENVTPLHVASQNGHEEVVDILIENGASINARCYDGTPLHLAAGSGHNNIIGILLAHKADINIIDSKKRRAVELAVANGHLPIVKVLLEHPKRIDINTRSMDDFTLLHIAAQEGFLEISKFLVEKGANIHARNESGSKPIHIAAREDHLDIVKFYLDQGMSINDFGVAHQTMLHYASISGNLRVVKYLSEMGCDINMKDKNGITPLQFAYLYNHQDLVEYLLNKGATSSSNQFQQLVDMTDTSELNTPLESTSKLFRALKQENISEFEDAIKEGAVVNSRNKFSKTPLHLASYKGNDKIVALLLQNKADPKIMDNKGLTPLHYAAEASHLKVVEMLLSHGAIYNATDKNGVSPCQYTSDERISSLLNLLEGSFTNIKKGRKRVIRDLKKLKDVKQVRAVMCANNREHETLVVCAIKTNFPKVDCLKEILQENVSTRINYAQFLISGCKYQEGLNILRSVLEERRGILGPDNPGTWDIQYIIAIGLYKQGSLLEALDMAVDIVNKQTDALGIDFRDTLKTRSFQALMLHRLSRNEEALNIFREVYPIQKELLGAHHEEVVETLFHMGLVLEAQNKYDEALSINKEVFKVRKETLGDNSPATLSAQNNIALVLLGQDKCEDALKIFQEVYEKRRVVLGEEHADTLRTLQKIGLVYLNQKQEHEALKIYKDLLKIQKKVFGPMHFDTLNTQSLLGSLYVSQGKWDSAKLEFSSCLDRMKKVYGPNHPAVLNIQKQMESVQIHIKMQEGQYVDAYQQMQKMSEKESNYENRQDIDLPLRSTLDQIESPHQFFPLHLAADMGSLEVVNALLKSGTDVNSQDSEGRTPLHHAVDKWHTAIVKTLIQNGADVTLASNKGNTPLHTAAIRGSQEVAEILLKNLHPEKLKDFVNAKTSGRGRTALHVAAERGYIEIALTLLAHGAMFDILDKQGKTPVDLSKDKDIDALLTLMDDLFNDAKAGNMNLIRKLKASKLIWFNALTNGRNYQGNTLFQVAIDNKNLASKLIALMRHIAD
ncbi:hypothetical protein LAZ67_20000861 [Cordylochernes scorpioides]|uniref:Ankyrin-1 n=1 Tax=Cordylochernes scorpioides TaxID=51811 RepID=A0ABY6LPB7_9ARAC|nr:hypothetical protein LAZ67_20000861 [Cordylochernes scorpioides]